MSAMVPYIVTVILLFTILVLWNKKKSSKWRTKLSANTSSNQEVTDEDEIKYVPVGLEFFIKAGFLAFLSSRKNPNINDTMYDKIYKKWGSQNSRNPKATLIAKFLHLTVVLPKNYNIIKTLLTNDNCTDRFPKNITKHYCRGRGKGVLFNSGDEAKELRRYTMKTLGHLGFGKNHKMSALLNGQLTDLLENLESKIATTDNKIQVHNLFTNSIISSVWCIIGGDKFLHDDPNLLLLYKNIEILSNQNLFTIFLLHFFSKRTIRYFDVFGLEITKFLGALETLDNYFHNYIEEKKLRLVETDPSNFVDYFLLEIEKHRQDNQLNRVYCKDQLAYLLMDLFAAGMDTTSKYMESAFMFMALNPNIQVQIQEEIDSIIGVRTPSDTTHRKRMPFTEAAIMEIHRLGNIIPTMPRMTNNHFNMDGRQFEKGEIILANFFSFRMDETYWGDPKVFRPERFFDKENNLITDKFNHVMPFGAGSRACLGASVATASIFVLLTGILQRYSIAQSDSNEFLGLSKGFLAVSHPEPFHVSLIDRNTK